MRNVFFIIEKIKFDSVTFFVRFEGKYIVGYFCFQYSIFVVTFTNFTEKWFRCVENQYENLLKYS